MMETVSRMVLGPGQLGGAVQTPRQVRKGKQSRAAPAFYSLATFNSIDIHEVRITVFCLVQSFQACGRPFL